MRLRRAGSIDTTVSVVIVKSIEGNNSNCVGVETPLNRELRYNNIII
jgi:hypothetical protein